MADRIAPILFPNLARGWDPFAPKRSMGPDGQGPLWRDLLNMRISGGELKRREIINAFGGTQIPTSVLTAMTPTAEAAYEEQIPRLIQDFQIANQSKVVRRLVVTTREVLYLDAATWKNITPVYSVGTIDVTNGTKAVTVNTGSPLWADRGIHLGNCIELPAGSGAWYAISTVTNTQITLENNFEGTTLTNAAYTIRRTLMKGYDGPTNLFFAHYFNGDLYIAGGFGRREVDAWDGMVLRLPDIQASGKSATDVEILFGGDKDYESGLDEIGYFVEIRGFQIMADGRLLLAGVSLDDVTPTSSNARLWYSSNVSPSVWTSSPGGAIDVVTKHTELTALGYLNGFYTIHFYDGIELAAPTGVDDPPVSIQGTSANQGTIAPLALRSTGSVEIFPGRNRRINIFDGVASRSVSRASRALIDDHQLDRILRAACAVVDTYREQYRLFMVDNPDAATTFTSELVFSYAQEHFGLAWPNQYGVPIGAVLADPYHGTTAMTYDRETLAGILGLLHEEAADSAMLWDLAEGEDDDEQTSANHGGTGATGGVYARSDELDFGLTGINSHIDHVTLWFRTDIGSPAAEDLLVGVSDDGGATWTYVTLNKTPSKQEQYAQFFFGKQPSESWRIHLGPGSVSPGTSLQSAFPRMTVHVVPGAPVERNT